MPIKEIAENARRKALAQLLAEPVRDPTLAAHEDQRRRSLDVAGHPDEIPDPVAVEPLAGGEDDGVSPLISSSPARCTVPSSPRNSKKWEVTASGKGLHASALGDAMTC